MIYGTDEQTVGVIKALVQVQAQAGSVAKDGKNPHFRSTYATLASVMDAIREPLRDSGFAILQSPSIDDGHVRVATYLYHTTGGYAANTVVVQPRDLSPQSVGSAITYARRYGIMALLSLAPDDDDGNGAQPQRQAPQPQPQPKTTDDKRKEMIERIRQRGGDVALCAEMSEQELMEYGLQLKRAQETAPAPEPQGPAPELQAAPEHGKPAQVAGVVVPDHALVSEKVCRFAIRDDDGLHTTIAVFSRSAPSGICWWTGTDGSLPRTQTQCPCPGNGASRMASSHRLSPMNWNLSTNQKRTMDCSSPSIGAGEAGRRHPARFFCHGKKPQRMLMVSAHAIAYNE